MTFPLPPLQLEDATSPWTSRQCRLQRSSSTARCKPQRQESITRVSRGSQGPFTPHPTPGRAAQRPCKPGQAAGSEVCTAAPLTQPCGSSLSPPCPAPPSPHLSQKKLSICGRCRDDGWLGGEASGHLRARASRPGWLGALGRGQRTPPPASLNTVMQNFS